MVADGAGGGSGGGGGAADPVAAAAPSLDAAAPPTDDEIAMMRAMGIPVEFDTTQGRRVDDDSANASGVKVKSTRSARQFMNRRGGFNRPLPAEVTGRRVIRD